MVRGVKFDETDWRLAGRLPALRHASPILPREPLFEGVEGATTWIHHENPTIAVWRYCNISDCQK